MVRMELDGIEGVAELRFDLQSRTLTVLHTGGPGLLLARLEPLGLGATVSRSEDAALGDVLVPSADAEEARTLRVLLAVNAVMFAVELVAGWLAQSTGLIADSLDMLADAMTSMVAACKGGSEDDDY